MVSGPPSVGGFHVGHPQEDSAKGAAELVGTLRELADPRREF